MNDTRTKLLAGYRDTASPPEARARVWNRLQRATPIAAPPRRASRLVAVLGLALAVAAAIVLVLGLAEQLAIRTATVHREQSVDAADTGADVRTSVEVATPPPARAIGPRSMRSDVASTRAVDPPRTVTPTSPRTPSIATEDPLRAELRAIEAARSAVDGHDHATALRRLADYLVRHPSGVFRPEALALRAIALCEAGRTAQGRGEAHVLLQERESAAHHDRVRAACGLQ